MRDSFDARNSSRNEQQDSKPPTQPEAAAKSSSNIVTQESPSNAQLHASQAGALSHSESDAAGTLSHYVARAIENSPELKAAFARYRASVTQGSAARKLPDPVLSFGYYVSRVETRVGPQLARLGLSQTFPWPTQLSAAGEANAHRARAAEKTFDAAVLLISREVARAYYSLWSLRAQHAVHAEHIQLLRQIEGSAQARLEVGSAELSDLTQVQLGIARTDDSQHSLVEQENIQSARLKRLLADASLVGKLPTTSAPPEPGLPSMSLQEVVERAENHPSVTAYQHLADARHSEVEQLSGKRYPSLTVGVDWIITGKASMAGVQDSGKDALMVGGGISIPLWQGSYQDAEDAARASEDAARFDALSKRDERRADAQAAYYAVRDSYRRTQLYTNALLPQAEITYDSVLGSYSAGKSSIFEVLSTQQELLELRLAYVVAQATHEQAWAELEQAVGIALERHSPRLDHD